MEYEKYTKIGNKYIHNTNLNQFSKNQAELKNINNKEKKLPESSGEVKTVEKCKSQIINHNNLSNFSEAVNDSL